MYVSTLNADFAQVAAWAPTVARSAGSKTSRVS